MKRLPIIACVALGYIFAVADPVLAQTPTPSGPVGGNANANARRWVVP